MSNSKRVVFFLNASPNDMRETLSRSVSKVE